MAALEREREVEQGRRRQPWDFLRRGGGQRTQRREAVAQLGDCSNGSEADRSDSRDLDGRKSVMEALCEVMGFWRHGRWCGDTTVEGQGSELGDEGSKGDEHSAELDMVVEETQLQGKGIEMGQREKSGLWCRPILHRGKGFSSFTEIP
ncbi:hypothetical protein F0562_002984 [Nyssa sinensis]|uniref:Uncharacterized protein n=1 Tax=Nyssa sinensis TaxID=561372 RepID=A0A5J5BX54_9ASTE|nr:hypothetical protein F0562_002984 [Nyssa sinensis]